MQHRIERASYEERESALRSSLASGVSRQVAYTVFRPALANRIPFVDCSFPIQQTTKIVPPENVSEEAARLLEQVPFSRGEKP